MIARTISDLVARLDDTASGSSDGKRAIVPRCVRALLVVHADAEVDRGEGAILVAPYAFLLRKPTAITQCPIK